ncbi:MAG: DUF4175 family protein [Phaeovulum sp.]|uniref:DUF4175 domain-containing protein n=1 Tax=Phaeovulum sp. TaxID=2934796 RepID=UPI0027330B70|nr:DUF4175 family protein [Phaeovulum sp.]MDP3860838.1 DUF4175 family protein [Phaeovulum sp.]
MKKTHSPVEMALRRLRLPLALTWAGLVVERALRAFWPLLSLLACINAALAFGAAGVLGTRALQAAAGLSALAGVVALGFGLWRFRLPARSAATLRLDASLPGRPIAAMTDTMALGGAGADALWEAHRARMAARTASARAVPPRPALVRRDRFGLRLMALSALAMALLFGAPPRLSDLAPVLPGGTSGGAALAAIGPSWEGWATPPRYTDRPALYLNALETDTLSLPEGTRLSLRLYGAAGALSLAQDVGDLAPVDATAAAGAVQVIDWEAVRSGTLTITGPGGRAFALTVLSDTAPFVEPLAAATRRADGKLSQPFRARDDFGVLRGRATITLDLAAADRRYGLLATPEPREPLVFDLPLPITGSRADFSEILVEDAARHPFANLPVRLTLSVEDGRGQQGTAAPLAMELPGRRFFDPLAAALIEMRRDLLWSRENAPRVAQVLKAVSYLPEDANLNARTYLPLRTLIGQLDGALAQGPLAPELRDELAEALWLMAERIEDGGLADALAEMQRAQQRLSEAMRNGASPDEIARLMAELKQATDNYIRMLAERGAQTPQDEFARNNQGQQITGDQIQQLMDEIQRLMEAGRMAEAQELLNQLAQLMENLQVTQGGEGGGLSPGQQSLRRLGETLRDQQGLSDELFGQMQQPGEGQEGGGQQGQQPGQPGSGSGVGGGPGSDGLPQRQRDLRQRLGLQQDMLPGEGTPEGESVQRLLDDAGRAMDEAERALREGDNRLALDRQAEAIKALREGMRGLGEMLADEGQNEPGRSGRQPGDVARLLPRDPLGRQAGEGGQVGTDETLLRGEDVYRRARDLLDEIRRRSGERLRPAPELDYLRRLLEMF